MRSDLSHIGTGVSNRRAVFSMGDEEVSRQYLRQSGRAYGLVYGGLLCAARVCGQSANGSEEGQPETDLNYVDIGRDRYQVEPGELHRRNPEIGVVIDADAHFREERLTPRFHGWSNHRVSCDFFRFEDPELCLSGNFRNPPSLDTLNGGRASSLRPELG